MGLTEQQITFFDTFGYLAFPGLFADEADTIIDRFEAVWRAHGGGHDGTPTTTSADRCYCSSSIRTST